MRKLDTMNGVAPYNPFSRSLMKVERSSRKAGTYATAINDMKAEPKNYSKQASVKEMFYSFH